LRRKARRRGGCAGLDEAVKVAEVAGRARLSRRIATSLKPLRTLPMLRAPPLHARSLSNQRVCSATMTLLLSARVDMGLMDAKNKNKKGT
jgi:hypothetical protein